MINRSGQLVCFYCGLRFLDIAFNIGAPMFKNLLKCSKDNKTCQSCLKKSQQISPGCRTHTESPWSATAWASICVFSPSTNNINCDNNHNIKPDTRCTISTLKLWWCPCRCWCWSRCSWGRPARTCAARSWSRRSLRRRGGKPINAYGYGQGLWWWWRWYWLHEL